MLIILIMDHPKSFVIYKMREIYGNKSTNPISVQLSSNSGTTLIGIWKEKRICGIYLNQGVKRM